MRRAVARFIWITGLLTAACSAASEPRVVFVTATPGELAGILASANGIPSAPPAALATEATSLVTAIPVQLPAEPREHVIQPGDTLTGIASLYNTTIDALLQLNDLANPNIIAVGQVLRLPERPTTMTPGERIFADPLLVRGPGSSGFDIAGFISTQPGYIRSASDTVATRLADGGVRNDTLSAAEVVARVSLEFSVDPRLLLAMLEYRAGWLSQPEITEALRTHPMISQTDSGAIDRSGLYRQLAWTANELNRGYYGWKYSGWDVIEFRDGERLQYQPTLNAGSVALQHMLRLHRPYTLWLYDVSREGFYATYARYFGAPESATPAPTSDERLIQPLLTLPFASGETWFYTGGPHGGWGAGSAWGAIDFAPPDERRDALCYTSAYWATAVAPGVIARSGDGVVILDLDGDGDEATGWTILYLHLAADGRIAQGTRVETGDRIGRPSCEGGFSTATHMHIARRYNGEWLPADCHVCRSDAQVQPFTMSGWVVVGLRNQEYQGYMQRAGERRTAEQGRTNPVNRVSW